MVNFDGRLIRQSDIKSVVYIGTQWVLTKTDGEVLNHYRPPHTSKVIQADPNRDKLVAVSRLCEELIIERFPVIAWHVHSPLLGGVEWQTLDPITTCPGEYLDNNWFIFDTVTQEGRDHMGNSGSFDSMVEEIRRRIEAGDQ